MRLIKSHYRRFDIENGNFYEWHGGQGVNCYTEDGTEYDYFTMSGPQTPTLEEVEKAIEEHAEENS